MLNKSALLVIMAFLLMIGGVIIFDLLPLWEKRQGLQRLIDERRNEFEAKKHDDAGLQVKEQIKTEEDLSNLYHTMMVAGVQVKELVLDKKQGHADGRAAHFIADAHYLSALAFIQALNASPSFVLLNAELKISRDHSESLLFEGDVLRLNQPRVIVKSLAFPPISPFCKSRDAYPEKASLIPSVEGMHMLAYLQQGEKARAIIRLNNSELLTVEKNQLVGKEQAKVMSISSQGVWMQLNNQLILYK